MPIRPPVPALLIAALLTRAATGLAGDTPGDTTTVPAAEAEAVAAPAAGTAAAPPTDSAAALTPGSAPRRFTVSGETGWNSLTGAGPVLAWRFAPQFAAEAGVGISGVGAKVSGRVRWSPAAGRWSPVFGAGVIHGSGAPDLDIELEEVDAAGTRSYTFRLKASTFLQGVTGVEYRGDSGLTWLLTVGYAHLLNDNVSIIAGAPSDLMRSAMRIAYGSGMVFAVSLGWSF